MKVSYCDGCGSKIISDKLDDVAIDGKVYCANCRPLFQQTSSALISMPLEVPRSSDNLSTVVGLPAPFLKPAAEQNIMKFYFCETCGKRITDKQIAAGLGRDKKLKGVYCWDCAEGVTTMEFTEVKQLLEKAAQLSAQQANAAVMDSASNPQEPAGGSAAAPASPRHKASDRSLERGQGTNQFKFWAAAGGIFVAVVIGAIIYKNGVNAVKDQKRGGMEVAANPPPQNHTPEVKTEPYRPIEPALETRKPEEIKAPPQEALVPDEPEKNKKADTATNSTPAPAPSEVLTAPLSTSNNNNTTPQQHGPPEDPPKIATVPQATTPPKGTQGLLVHWKLDEAKGTSAADSSGNGYQGKLMNFSDPPGWGAGKVGSALKFDGVDDHIAMEWKHAPNDELSVACWVKYSEANVTGRHAYSVTKRRIPTPSIFVLAAAPHRLFLPWWSGGRRKR